MKKSSITSGALGTHFDFQSDMLPTVLGDPAVGSVYPVNPILIYI